MKKTNTYTFYQSINHNLKRPRIKFTPPNQLKNKLNNQTYYKISFSIPTLFEIQPYTIFNIYKKIFQDTVVPYWVVNLPKEAKLFLNHKRLYEISISPATMQDVQDEGGAIKYNKMYLTANRPEKTGYENISGFCV